jgi:hypothetical protein
MEVIEYVEKIDERMSKINKNYKYIYENIHNYLNDGKIGYEQLMDYELSLQNLSIELNKLVYLFNQQDMNENNTINHIKYNNKNNNNNNDNNNDNDKQNIEKVYKMDTINKMDKIDYALDKTIFHFLPLLFMYFMIFDNESILYIKNFIEKKDNTINNTKTINTFILTKEDEDSLNDLD